MRILQVIPAMTGFFGGPATATKLLCQQLAKTEKVLVITTAASNQTHDLQNKPFMEKKNGYLTLFFPRIIKSRALNMAFYFSPSMRAAFRQYIRDVDVIHLESWRTIQDFFVYLYARKYHIPYIIEARGDITPKGGRIKETIKMIYNLIFGYHFLKSASKFIALTENERELFLQLNIPKEKIVIIPNGINLNVSQNAINQKDSGLDLKLQKYENLLKKTSIIFLGRVHPVKNVDLIIKAFGEVVKSFPEVNLFIIGPIEDQVHFNFLKSLILTENIMGKVIFTGLLNEREKFQIMVRGSIFVLPSKSEGFSNAILEAMSARLPVVISTGCNFPEVAVAQAGIIIQPRTTDLCTALLKLLKDPALQQKMGKNGFDLVNRKYSMESVNAQVVKLYKVIKSHG